MSDCPKCLRPLHNCMCDAVDCPPYEPYKHNDEEIVNSEIKPCPFCGDLASLNIHGCIFKTGSNIGFRVECEGRCHSMTCYWHTKEEAISAWNARICDRNAVLDEVTKGLSSLHFNANTYGEDIILRKAVAIVRALKEKDNDR